MCNTKINIIKFHTLIFIHPIIHSNNISSSSATSFLTSPVKIDHRGKFEYKIER